MTENAKINEVLRAIFKLSGDPLTLFFTWGLMQPLDERAAEKAAECRYAKKRRANPEVKERERLASREYYAKNTEKCLAATHKWFQENPEARLESSNSWNHRNPDRVRAKRKRQREKPGHKKGRRERYKMRMASDPQYKIRHALRSRINKVLMGKSKSATTLALLAMELPEFKIYIQGQFAPGMTWKNHGNVWHLDHVRPCAKFDLRDPAHQRECFHWSNYQPLFALDNLRKGAKCLN